MEVKFIQKYEPSTVKIEAEFFVDNPAKLISAWAKLPHAMDILTQETEHSINWASCILDLMMENLNEEKLGIRFDSSVCDKNPEPRYTMEEYKETFEEV